METKRQTFEHAAAMPAATWNYLKMNDTKIEVPDGIVPSPQVQVVVPEGARGAADEFDNALADAQEAWEREHPAPTAAELAERAAAMEAEADATYGGTAQSAYQKAADELEEACLLAQAFEPGMGREVAAYLRAMAGERTAVWADAHESVKAQVVVRPKAGAFSAAAIDVITGEGADVQLSIVVDSPDSGSFDGESCDGESSDSESSDGYSPDGGQLAYASESSRFVGTTVRVFADKGARVEIARTQTLDDDAMDIDDMGLFIDASARVAVRQTVLGAARAYTGLAADLRGAAGGLSIDTRYLGRESQQRDFNYIVRHHGERTESDLKANGVLAGKSQKTLRGTIDLIRGCKGAQGSETETVLLVDEGVDNKTVPTILCNEDDVAGNHGATIGHVRDEQLFYLASRGLSQESAERMFVSALIEQAAIDAADEAARAGVVRLGERVAPGFAEFVEG